MEQVILNLALNARDAMAAGGTLTVITSRRTLDVTAASLCGIKEGEYVILTVADTGRGIDPQVRPHIFEPFFTTKEGKGSGLGLSIVYGIVQQAGGNVLVESEVGQGARFDVYLPVHHQQEINED
jgi:two-component system, cell cycle sensor histidine kinase and response regulator CckA